MEFSGERYVPSVGGQIRYEHVHRYALSLPFVEQRVVLDLASGEGYGAALLASKASFVIGVDADVGTVGAAEDRYGDPRLRFVAGDCGAVPIADATFDVVTSFETIEHHDRHARMMAEIKRVLKPGGVLILSSPNRPVYARQSPEPNPFHVKELDYDELAGLVGEHFAHCRVYGQRIAAGSVVAPLSGDGGIRLDAWTGDEGRVRRRIRALPDPVYFLAVCSDDARRMETEISSVYFDRAADLLRLLEDDKREQIDRMGEQVARTDAELAKQRRGYEAEIERQTREISIQRVGYEAEIERQTQELERVHAGYKSAIESQHDAMGQLQSDNRELIRSAHEAGERLALTNQQLAAANVQLTQKDTIIRDQTDTIVRFTGILNWFHLSRAWGVARRLQLLNQVRQRWVARISGRRRAFHGAIDAARLVIGPPDRLDVSGWVYSKSSRIQSIEVFVGPRYLGGLRYGIPRSEVTPGAPVNCGYADNIDVSGLGISGNEMLRVRVRDATGNLECYESPIAHAESGSPEPAVVTESVGEKHPGEEESFGPAERRVVGETVAPQECQALADLIAEFQTRTDRYPSILDWESGLELAETYRGMAICSPPPGCAGELPYLDDSIDVVVVGPRRSVHLAEGRRVAATAVLHPGESDDAFTVEWQAALPIGRPLPTASIVIPVFNNVDFTQQCLERLQATVAREFDYVQIIVVDDASTDTTSAFLERWAERDDRHHVLSNSENRGFVFSCNRGAEIASGDTLVFLNNDTLPMPGWLQPLLALLRDSPDAGVVGGKLLYPDGRLQEAGGVVFSDGSACNFGKGLPAGAPLGSFLREVDYCSGAMLATPRGLFSDLGGFDTRFAPGYYEDTDYCFRVRASGYRVYYQPESVVVHFEGASAGTDGDAGMKRYQAVNRTKFIAKWSDTLKDHPKPPENYDFETLHQLSVRGAGG